jgi:hypothetical protein
MSWIYKWISNIIYNKIPMYLMGFLFAYFLVSLYCYIFKISHLYFFVYYIMPIFGLIGQFIYIIKTLIKFPYYITMEVWNMLLRILSMFTVVIDVFNAFTLFFINLTVAI